MRGNEITHLAGEDLRGIGDLVAAIAEFAPLWDELFPTEQARIIRLLVARVDITPGGMDVRLRAEGLGTLVEQLGMKAAA